MSDADAFARLRALFGRISELPSAEREVELAALAAEPELADELRDMLATLEGGDSALDRPALRAPEGFALLPRIPGYRIERRLGRGGSATVYLASQEKDGLERDVALKVVDQVLDAEGVRRVQEEKRILARLEHPGIARLYDAGVTAGGQPYLVMERVSGTTIVEHCRERHLAVPERLSIFLDVLAAVAFAHRAGVVHRDLKPGNILVTAAGEAKLLDFGIAKRVATPGEEEETRTLRRALTPSYASPEQIRGDRVTALSDVYSLGVVLYELLAEVLPYRVDGSRFEMLEDAIRLQDPEAPSSAITRAVAEENTTQPVADRLERTRRRRALRGDLDAVVLKALRKQPAARYSTVEAFAADIERVLVGLPVEARGANRRYRAGRWLRRRGKVIGITALVAVGIAIAAVPAWREKALLPLLVPSAADELSVFDEVRAGDSGGRRDLREGARALARGDGVSARTRFRRAAERLAGTSAEALALDGLSRAEASLGEIGRAAEAARAAAAALRPESPGAAGGDEGARIAARALAAIGDFERAVPALDRLFARQPDRLDLGLDLAAALLASGQTDAAAATVARMEQLPAQARPALRDPRLDLAEAEVAYRLGEHQRAVAAATRARDRAEATGVVALRLRAERRRAESFARLDLRDEAERELRRIAAEASALGLAREAAAARFGVGKALTRTSDNDAAEATLETALAGLRAAGDRAGEVEALTILAFQAAKRGDIARGLGRAREAVTVARAIGDRWSESEALTAELALLNWSGDTAAVLAARDGMLQAMRESSNRQSLLLWLENFAIDAIDRRDLDRAEAWLAEAEPLAERVGGRLSTAGLDRARGVLEESRGAWDRARELYESALGKARRAEVPSSAAVYLADLAGLELAADRPEAAERRANAAIAEFRAQGRVRDAVELEGVLAWVDARRGDRQSAKRRLATLNELPEGNVARITHLTIEARVAEALGDWSEAIALREKAVRVAEQSDLGGRIDQGYWLARDLAAAGRTAEARGIARELLAEAERLGLGGIVRGLREILAGGRPG